MIFSKLDFEGISLEHGISTYHEVIVVWDEDYDTRVLLFIDDLPYYIKKELFAVHEREGHLILVWKDKIPNRYFGDKIDVRNGIEKEDGEDTWTIDNFITNCKIKI